MARPRVLRSTLPVPVRVRGAAVVLLPTLSAPAETVVRPPSLTVRRGVLMLPATLSVPVTARLEMVTLLPARASIEALVAVAAFIGPSALLRGVVWLVEIGVAALVAPPEKGEGP